ncbi:MAG: hypothetical protein ACLRMN_12430 [Mediterraneibacter gnavus]
MKNYFALVEKKQYDKMYDMLSESSKEKYQKEIYRTESEYLRRNRGKRYQNLDP